MTATNRDHIEPFTLLCRLPLAVAALAAILTGCRFVPDFPPRPLQISRTDGQQLLAYDIDSDGHVDYWQRRTAAGRTTLLQFDDDRDGQPDTTVQLDRFANSKTTHLVIILDGVPFRLVESLYQQGYFRLFYPPARLISCFPSMTDLALSLVFHSQRCLGYEALFFDRQANRLSDGNAIYLSGANAPWSHNLTYRCSFWWDANAYLSPRAVFDHELRGLLRAFKKVQRDQAFAYTVATAGLGTRGGRAAILDYLKTIDRLCQQIVYRHRGNVKLTLLADHGHNLTPNRRISFKRLLRQMGYHLATTIKGPADVVVIEYGLVTYAAICTDDPAGVADVVLDHPAVDLVTYPQDRDIVVRDRTGQARIRKIGSRYRYDIDRGDPLRLKPVLAQLASQGKVSPDGLIDDRALFQATIEHIYPDPLARIWLAFHGLVKHPPDLIVSLRDGYCHGSKLFDFAIGGSASTHGSLNRINSTTFVMTMLGPLPPALRPADVLPTLDRLRRAGPDQATSIRTAATPSGRVSTAPTSKELCSPGLQQR